MNYTNAIKDDVSVCIIRIKLFLILAEIDEDPGYGTLQKSLSTDSRDSGWLTISSLIKFIFFFLYLGSVISYVVHDRTLQNELNEYSKRLLLLIDNLKSDISNRNKRKKIIFDNIFLFKYI